MDTVYNSRKHIGDLFVCFMASAKFAVISCMEGNVASIDGSSSLEGCFYFRKRATTLNFVAQQLGIVRAVDVHLKIRLVCKHAGLPVLFKVLWGNHAHGLNFHGLKTEGNNVVHSFNNCASLA